jgi:quercetin 2,3-dioxygenase
MKKNIYRQYSRGHLNYGWLDTYHSFSFSSYYNPDRIRFGMLRVLNDDIVAPGKGFDLHPHDNMEIITIPHFGSLQHTDSTGKKEIIATGDIQVMSAGSGIWHSEFNPSQTEIVNLFQIWILPLLKDVTPRYDQKTFSIEERKNRFQLIVSPDGSDGSLTINQKAYLSLSDLDINFSLNYPLKNSENGVFLIVIDGEIEIADEKLNKRDAIEINESNNFDIRALLPSQVLVIEVPMRLE